jgi:hypothetical protein
MQRAVVVHFQIDCYRSGLGDKLTAIMKTFTVKMIIGGGGGIVGGGGR